MAIVPISQPLAPGLLAVDYSPWSLEAGSRSGFAGLSGFLDYTNPTGLTGYTPDISPPTWSAPGGPMVSDVEPVEGTGGSGLPMPDVEGYKYVYPRYEYTHGEWGREGYEDDRDAYDYYPYWPTDIGGGSPILVGVELKKE